MIRIEDKIASLFIVGFRGLEPSDTMIHALQHYRVGGIILFDKDYKKSLVKKDDLTRNIRDPKQLLALTHSLRQTSLNDRLLLAIDYEGGEFSCLTPRHGFPATKSAEVIATLDAKSRHQHFELMANTLVKYGFNLVFAPVVDLKLAENMLSRSQRLFSSDPRCVVEIARSFMDVMNSHKIIPCLKHFPGHGSSLADSHFSFADVTSTWHEDELMPYRALVSYFEQTMIMTAHVINRHLDPSNVPATLSYPMITQLLKNTLGFKGAVIADDMQMQAITSSYSQYQAMVSAFNAGCDMLIYSNQMGDDITFPELIDAVLLALDRGEITEARIDDALTRIEFLHRS